MKPKIRTKPGRRLACALSSSIALALAVPAGASALTFVADASIPDTDASTCVAQQSGGGVCSLRRAVVAADTADGNTVIVNAGSYAITQGVVPAGSGTLTHAMSIQGAGAASTIIDGSGEAASFLVPGIVSGTLSLSGMTVTGFKASNVGGGAIDFLGGSLALSEMVFDHDTAVNLGGAIRFTPGSGSQITIDSSTFSHNSAGVGGAINVNASAPGIAIAIGRSTFADNAATSGTGGAIRLVPAGQFLAATITNSTFAGNTAAAAGGAIVGVQAPMNLALGFDTFTANQAPSGAALAIANNAGAFGSITGTIFAGATGECALGTGNSFNDGGSNLSIDTSCALTAGGDQQGVDARLLALGSYGGPTQTAALGVGSPAVDAALSCPSFALDQRGIVRPQGTGCDIGAFEARPPTLAGVPTVSGPATVGNTLTCVPPTVNSPDGTPVISFTWSRDGVKVATGATYTLTVADQAHAVACRFTATSAGGSASAASSAVTVGAPPRALAPKLTLASKTVSVSVKTGKGSVKATCTAPAGQSCVFKGTLYGPGTLPGAKAAAARTRAKKIGAVTGTIAAGKQGRLRVKVTRGARKQLKRSHRLKARLRGTVTDKAGNHTSLRATLTLKAKQETA